MSWHRISLVAVCLLAVGGTIALADSLPKNRSSQILAQNSEKPLNLGKERGAEFLAETQSFRTTKAAVATNSD